MPEKRSDKALAEVEFSITWSDGQVDTVRFNEPSLCTITGGKETPAHPISSDFGLRRLPSAFDPDPGPTELHIELAGECVLLISNT